MEKKYQRGQTLVGIEARRVVQKAESEDDHPSALLHLREGKLWTTIFNIELKFLLRIPFSCFLYPSMSHCLWVLAYPPPPKFSITLNSTHLLEPFGLYFFLGDWKQVGSLPWYSTGRLFRRASECNTSLHLHFDFRLGFLQHPKAYLFYLAF